MKSLRTSFIFAVCFIAAPALVWAASFVMPSDAELIDSAEAIVIATAGSSRAEPSSVIGIVTVTDLVIERVLKGSQIGSSLQLTEIGGRIGDFYVVAEGAPRFAPGERALLFLERSPRGEWRVSHMLLGKFNFVRDDRGVPLLVRALGGHGVWDMHGRPQRDPARAEKGFLDYIAARVQGKSAPEDYFLQPDLVKAGELFIAPMATRTDYLTLAGNGQGFRWPTPSATFLRFGTVSGLDADGAMNTGMGMWNGAGAGVSYSNGGTTTNNTACADLSCLNNINQVVYGDPNEVVSGSFGAGGGVLGIGIVFGSGNHTVGGETFISIPEGDVVMNNGISSGNSSQSLLDHSLAHELGHTLGFRHSDESGRTPNTTDSIMKASVTTIFTSLRQYDLDAVQTVYGSGPVCSPPSITTQPQSQTIASGGSATLTVGAGGTSPFAYQWFRGNSGDTSQPIAGATGSSFNTGALTTTTSYWVRVTGQCDPPVNSQTATITVAACIPPSISTQPQSQNILSGNSATLSVGASGTTPFSYQWFMGSSGNTSQPIPGATGSSFNTGPLTTTTSYWVRVTGQCAPPADSQTATITVGPCTPPSITTQPQPQTVQSGGNVILSVGATGTGPLSYQWYRGNSGDTSSPVIGANFDTVSIGPLTQNTNFWVRVTGQCGSPADSVSVTVTVTAQCTPISITSQPASTQISAGASATLTVGVTGTSPSFQWFQGTPPGGTPVGTNSPNLTVAPTVTTSYYVRVSNACSGPINSAVATVTVCPAGTLCLASGRFRVTMLARNPDNNATDTGLALQENQTFGFYALTALTGDPNNLEVFVKIVGPLPDGTFIVFFGGLTGFEYSITVRDMTTGLTDVYTKPANQSRNGFAIFRGARSAEEDCPIGFTGTPQPSQFGTCIPGDLCLHNSRFRVRLMARNHRNNQTAAGVDFRKTNQFGYFALPGLTGDLTNPEVFVKVLGPVPRPGLPDQFWVFFAGLTDFEYTITVTDLTNGQTKTFFKPAEKLCGGADTAAFPF